MTVQLAVMGLAVLIGAVAQRATGMGFALLASPFLVLALGPLDGVVVTNVCGAVSAAIILAQVWRDVDRPRAAWIVPLGMLGCLPGAYAVARLPQAWLALVVALIVLVALVVSIAAPAGSLADTRLTRSVTGFCSGFMNVTGGVGGPALAVYGRATRWEHRAFAGTAQLHFLLVGLMALASKAHVPAFPPLGWGILAAALVIGQVVGTRVARHLSGFTAMKLVLAMAMVGTLLALGKALYTLLG
ncbi:sulfite exporter TauE/SafE family protein [Mariniluteicoccus flavus]